MSKRAMSAKSAEKAGVNYAKEQVGSDHFRDWVWDQMSDADQQERRNPGSMIPANTPDNARQIARNMLQQLKWDTKRELDPREILGQEPSKENEKAFWVGFEKELAAPTNLTWLTDLVLEFDEQLRGVPRSRAVPHGATVHAKRSAGATRWTVEGGRGIHFDGKPFIGVSREGNTQPVEADGATHVIVDCFNRTGVTPDSLFEKHMGHPRKTHRHESRAMREVSAGSIPPVDDPDYVIQGTYSDGKISEEFGYNDKAYTVEQAKKLLKSPYFEGEHVRVITRDGELVWDSRSEQHRRAGETRGMRAAHKHEGPYTIEQRNELTGGRQHWSKSPYATLEAARESAQAHAARSRKFAEFVILDRRGVVVERHRGTQ